jgi:deazaflavin-dependent oxidoreductase (nitroreductase family)
MRWMLCTPGFQRIVGRSTCLLIFTGRRSGRSYATPISYVRDNGRAILTCHPSRQWWRNLDARPDVTLRLQGRDTAGVARVVQDPEAVDLLEVFLEGQPLIARSLGMKRRRGERFSPADLKKARRETTVVAVDLSETAGRNPATA